MNINEILKKFEGVKPIGNNSYKCICPNHLDKEASLVITAKGDKILFNCFAGCNYEDILKKKDLKKRDLFNSKGGKDIMTQEIEKEYYYTDENWNNLYKSIRYKPKSFRQAKFCESNKWEYNMNNVKHVIYNLPNVIKSEEIYFVEGEKDADNLINIGLTATTTVGGAKGFKKYESDYIKPLKDKIVYIIPDNDDAGRNYANKVYTALDGIAKKVKILNLTNEVMDLKQKGDISDVLTEYGIGNTLKILENLKNRDYLQNKPFPLTSIDDLNENTFHKLLEFLGIN